VFDLKAIAAGVRLCGDVDNGVGYGTKGFAVGQGGNRRGGGGATEFVGNRYVPAESSFTSSSSSTFSGSNLLGKVLFWRRRGRTSQHCSPPTVLRSAAPLNWSKSECNSAAAVFTNGGTLGGDSGGKIVNSFENGYNNDDGCFELVDGLPPPGNFVSRTCHTLGTSFSGAVKYVVYKLSPWSRRGSGGAGAATGGGSLSRDSDLRTNRVLPAANSSATGRLTTTTAAISPALASGSQTTTVASSSLRVGVVNGKKCKIGEQEGNVKRAADGKLVGSSSGVISSSRGEDKNHFMPPVGVLPARATVEYTSSSSKNEGL